MCAIKTSSMFDLWRQGTNFYATSETFCIFPKRQKKISLFNNDKKKKFRFELLTLKIKGGGGAFQTEGSSIIF